MRILIILGPFVLAIGGLVFLQAGLFAPNDDARLLPGQAPTEQASAVAQVIAQIQAEAQAEAQADLPTPILAQTATATASSTTTGAATGAQPSEIQALTSSVLANLGVQLAGSGGSGGAVTAPATATAASQPPVSPPVAPGKGDEMRVLTTAILSGLTGYGASADASLEGIAARAAREAQSSAYIDMLVASASSANIHSVPGASGGTGTGTGTPADALARIDPSSTLLTVTPGSIVPTSAAIDVLAGPPPRLTALGLSQTTLEQDGKRYYIIRGGDSLTTIASRFYGDAAQATGIYQANTAVLKNVNHVRLGQKIHIPH